MNWIYRQLTAFLLLLSSTAVLCAKETDQPGYTINYNTVSILEYIQFASKICNTNFIYDEADLNFTVSVVSDVPITPENVMGTLVQLLRIHGFMLLEQDQNLVIHRSSDVRQIATLITGQNEGKNAPIVTRVFRTLNAKPETLAAIIRPMISTEALLETSPETWQLILTDVTINVDKVAALIEILDSPHTPLEIKSYDSTFNKLDFLIDTANQIMAPLTQGNPFILVAQPLSETIFVVSTPDLVDRTLSVLSTIDVRPKETKTSHKKEPGENMLIYNTKNRPPKEVLSALHAIAADINVSGAPEGDLVETIDAAKAIPKTNTILFFGSPYALAKIKELLGSLDTTLQHPEATDSFFLYKPQYRNAKELEKSIKEIGVNLKEAKDDNKSLIHTIDDVKLNPLTNTLLFSGDPADFPKIKELLATLDTETTNLSQKAGWQSNFFVYKIQHAPYTTIESSLKYLADQLDHPSASEKGLIETIQGMKYIEETNSILFTGPEIALKRLESLIPSFDTEMAFPATNNQLYIYKPKVLREEAFYQSIRELTEDLKKEQFTDPAFLKALQSVKWVKANGAFLFTGDDLAIKRVEELLPSLDMSGERSAPKPGYYIFKLQHASAEAMEEDIENLIKSFRASDVKDHRLIHALENIRPIEETNSLLVTGEPATLEEVKSILTEYDYPRSAVKAPQNSFLMIKAYHTTAPQLEKSLKEVACNLKKSELEDPNLLAAIHSMKYIEATNSFLFTGTPDALNKLQVLIKDLDVSSPETSPIHHIGKNSFLLYKLKVGNGIQVLASIKALSADLKKSGAADQEFICTLQTAKYVRETNSILFTGNEESLKKAELFVAKFDVPDLCTPKSLEDRCPVPSTHFFTYKPTSVPGPDLEHITQEFAQNLKLSGLSDPEFFDAIHSMRWVPQTQSLIFTGTPKTLDQIKDLITSFDVASNAPHSDEAGDGSIQGIENTNFMIYKLQYHKGDEIQAALRQIATDLIKTGAPINQNLLNAINSIQWIQITNSILASGDEETLTRLRSLIKDMDTPLKQVFIEMLVIETNLLNTLEFGLEWAGKYKYRNSFQGSINNISPPPTGGPCVVPDAFQQLNEYKPVSPMPAFTDNIPFDCGFDLGIIGQVIKHNGETFLSLGSLLSAIQTDDQTSVVVTPKIMTQDGRTTTLFSGSNVPFVGSFVNTNGQNTVQTSNIEYRDIGVKITVTPTLGNSDMITLDIGLERSQTLTNLAQTQLNFSNTSANGIITSKTDMRTTVSVKDKNFLILSGFVNNSSVKTTTGIPCLGGLPLVGAAFSKDNNTSNNQNIVIFLRPHIIRSADDMQKLTQEQEDAFRDQQASPFLTHEFDEGMELIKSIDDD